MAGISLHAEVRGLAPIAAILHSLSTMSQRHLAVQVGEYVLGKVQDRFDQQKLVDGSAMPQSKAAAARGGKTLIDKRHLYDSYTAQPTGGGVSIGSNLVYAAAMHFGLPERTITARGRALRFRIGGNVIFRRSVHVGATVGRPVLGISDADDRAIGDLVIAEIQRLGS